ncbi:amino acid transporter [Sporothrix schenckii 1099-18]|uniref:Amino acid transporter n=1 Tax=Sporothrix schenckii 1099-18 TaxID=1397361 RepID=A0A0F2MI28_SPOSC|nr:amino acid transporter [Sporothrix schenckii 1099-18]KJR88485.1 amino acid transporter [Sporothrix schenckii 1099-18]
MAKPGNLAIDGADPRVYDQVDKELNIKGPDDNEIGAITNEQTSVATAAAASAHRRRDHQLHDPTITFEQYHYYAKQTRAEEEAQPRSGYETTIWSLFFPSKSDGGVKQRPPGEKSEGVVAEPGHGRMVVSDEEWINASRALRTATRGAIFYLITTDILGPFGLPYAFATMGWGPGITLFTIFAALAGYSGFLLWESFMGLDSYEYPVRNFGDMGYRLYGRWLRHLFNVLQSIQLLLNVGLIVISNGEALSQVAKFRLCFIVCCLIWAIVGFIVGQIRTLQKFGWLANAAVWINLICMFITMGGAAHSPPNYAGASSSAGASIAGGVSVTPDANGVFPPVQTNGGLPDTGSFVGSVSGAMQAIFAYGGSMVFPEFMAEMKRPKDFLTAMWAAQAFIYFWYMFYGLFLYGYQGQYTVNPSYLGISNYNIQTAGNVFAMLSAVIAACLYGNIGLKVMYNNVFVELLHAPPLTSRAGKWLWVAIIPVYWSIAFALAAGIPNFSGLTSVVTAFCILHFTYTFPPLLSVAFLVKKMAMREGDGYDPATGQVTRSGTGWERFKRGFFSPSRWWMNSLNIIYILGALALGGLGAYASIVTLRDAFAKNVTTSYVCKSPLDG